MICPTADIENIFVLDGDADPPDQFVLHQCRLGPDLGDVLVVLELVHAGPSCARFLQKLS